MSKLNNSNSVDNNTNVCTEGSTKQSPEKVITYVEFYSGVGGWTMALNEAMQVMNNKSYCSPGTLRLQRLANLDHSDLCQIVLEHNFPSNVEPLKKNKKRRRPAAKPAPIERLSLKQMEDWNATIFAMSPPCQPHTRQHSNQKADLEDPRSKSFLHLCDLILQMNELKLPRVILMENVVGFELSGSCQRWRHVLHERNYVLGHFHVNPTQVGIPNDRPRYFCVAVRNQNILAATDSLQKESHIEKCEPVVQTSVVSVGISPRHLETNDKERDKDPPFLDSISSFLDPEHICIKNIDSLRVPDKILQSSAAWCFDIVTPQDRRSACFTHAYGKFVRGTGSVLYTGPSVLQKTKESDQGMSEVENRFRLMAPEERHFDANWSQDLDLKQHLRYFSGTEMARLMGFPVKTASSSCSKKITSSLSFTFPANCSPKQQWKLLGNSLNVRVASRVALLGLSSVDWTR